MYNPLSTYRIQFNQSFTFQDLKKLIDYLGLLGTGTIYASPIFTATPGSMHGYDVVDPLNINPEIGNLDEFKELISLLKDKNIGWLQDIVPNHMAFHRKNTWLMDVLEKGIYSDYAEFFDIDWKHPSFNTKLMVPFLSGRVEEVLERGELKIEWQKGSFQYRYYEHAFPVNFETFHFILKDVINEMPSGLRQIWETGQFEIIKTDRQFLYKRWQEIRVQLETLYHDNTHFKQTIDEYLSRINADPSILKALHKQQHYALCFWKETEKRINYRRFFTINDLICLQMRKKEVFDTYHQLLEKFLKNHWINGIRVDHIDGLNHPVQYLERLRKLTGEDTYVIVEKILVKDEQLPSDWPLQGSTGYEFLALVNNLFTYKEHYPGLQEFYQKITGITDSPETIIYNKKMFIFTHRLAGELENLHRIFENSGFFDSDDKATTSDTRKAALMEFLLACPVYCLYSSTFPLSKEDQEIVKQMLQKATERAPQLTRELDLIRNLFLRESEWDNVQKEKAIHFFMRCMQFTGPLMAKGVEDTTMYYYNCFIAHDEVGDYPGSSGITIQRFHEAMQERQKQWPYILNTTSTHDTKRGEDVRARLNVISELAEEWMENVKRWMEINNHWKSHVDGTVAPSVNEEYLIYQNLAGIFPMDWDVTDSLRGRIKEYLVKALREAKKHTTWNEPDVVYERAVINFANHLLNPEYNFLKSFIPFQIKLTKYGVVNSISQLILKCTCPGIPDIYQGTEFWDLTLVDPDNRRPVDYGLRQSVLQELIEQFKKDQKVFYSDLIQRRSNGHLKLWITHLLLRERRENSALFAKGEYLPLTVKGIYKDHILAFARKYQNNWLIVAVPVHYAILAETAKKKRESFDWGDTFIELPGGLTGTCFINLLDRQPHVFEEKILLAGLGGELTVVLMRTVNL